MPTLPGNDTLSGTAFTDSGVTNAGSGTLIDLIFDGTIVGSTTTGTTGGFSFSVSSTDLTGGVLLTDATHSGNTYYQATIPTTTITGIDLWGDTLRVVATTASNTALGTAAGSLSGVGINYSSSSGALATNSGINMSILSHYTMNDYDSISVAGTLTTGSSAVVTTGFESEMSADTAVLSGSISGVDVFVNSPSITLTGATVTSTDTNYENGTSGGVGLAMPS